MNINFNEIVIEYIGKCLENEPIFLDEVRAYVISYLKIQDNLEKQKIFANINVIINRLNSENIIKTFTKGIYYKPIKNIFGEMPLDKEKVINKKYLQDENNNVIGYITGVKLFNQLGLTTQVPNITTIVTNNCNNKYDYKVECLNIIIRKSVLKVNNDNYSYLQFIDILLNKEKVNIEIDNYQEILYNYIIQNNLDFERIIKYARETENKKVLDYLLVLAR